MGDGANLESAAASPTIGTETARARRCPVCRAKIVVWVSSEVLIRNAIVRVDSPTGRVTAKCSRCKSWVEVPLRLSGDGSTAGRRTSHARQKAERYGPKG